MRKRVAITGLTGVIGKVLGNQLIGEHLIIDLFHNEKQKGLGWTKHIMLDLSKKRNITDALESAAPEVIVHMAAITHIDVCEMDKKNGKNGIVWKVNVEGTRRIAEFAAKNSVPIIFLSTECVFDGKKEFFDEDAKKNPINWYGVTKNEAEEVVMNSGAPFTIIRSVVAYHKEDNNKTIYGKVLNELKNKSKILMVEDQLFTPTYTHDIVKAIHKAINENLRGVLHVAPHKNLSPYSFAKIIALKNKYLDETVERIKLRKLYGTERASLRLKNSSLLSEKSSKLLKFKAKIPERVI